MSTSNLSHFLRHLRVLSEAHAARDLTDGELLGRFREGREETAFAILLQRHGPMVLGVCRRLLADAHAAEDAFQATFLVLVRKAASIRKQDSVASWLHGVARRIAVKARLRTARDSALERQAHTMPRPEPMDELTWQELRTVLDEELDQLPEKYRTPLVLCGLEGKTHEQAARELGWPKSSLTSRLVKARELLQERLAWRGIVLSSTALTAAVAANASAAMPARLILTTVRAALVSAAAHATTAVGISANVVALTEEGIKSLSATKLKASLTLLLTMSLLIAGTGVVAHHTQESLRPPEKQVVAKPSAQGRDKAQPEATLQAVVDRYGDPLPLGALARLGTMRLRHPTFTTCATFTSDSKTVLVSDMTGAIVYWDVATGKELRRIQAGPHIQAVAVSPNGKTLATGYFRLSLWDVATGTVSTEGPIELRLITQIAFAPDGKTVALRHLDNTIDLWDAATGQKLHTLTGHTGKVSCLAFAPDSKILASGSVKEPNVRFWDTATGKQVRSIVANDSDVQSVAFAPDGKVLATSGGHGSMRFWDLASGKLLREAEAPLGHSMTNLCFFPDGKAIAGIGLVPGMQAATGSMMKVRVFDVATGKHLYDGESPRPSMHHLAISPDGKTIATSWGNPRTMDLWDAATGKLLPHLEGHRQGVTALAFADEGRTLFAADGIQGDAVAEWDTASNKLIRRLGEDSKGASDLALSPDGRFLAACGYADHTIRLWELASGKEWQRLKGHRQNVLWVRFSADGKTLASASFLDKSLRLWDVATGREQRVIPLNEIWSCVVDLAADGSTVAVGGLGNGTVQLWDTATGKQIRTLTTPFKTVTMVSYTPDGKILATGSTNASTICLWDVASGRLVRQFDTRKSWTRGAFSPDGRTLALGESSLSYSDWVDRSVSLWEVATGRERARFLGHRSGVLSLAFSPDGRRLASGSNDTTILIWDVTGRPREVQSAEEPFSPKELDSLWTDLMGEEAARAYRALWALVGAPRQAVPLLQWLPPAVPPSDKLREQVARLLSELSNDDFAVRQQAETELVKLGTPALPQLRKALQEEPPLEIRRRLEDLTKRLEKAGEAERARQMRVLEVLEHLGTLEAKRLLEAYAAGAPGAELTEEAKESLQRLARRADSPRRESRPE